MTRVSERRVRLAILALACVIATLPYCFARSAHIRATSSEDEPVMSPERAVFQTSFGDIEMGFWPDIAPVSAPHISALIKMGCYNSNSFFRVDKGFVAQTSSVRSGRLVPLSPQQKAEAAKRVPLEVTERVKHLTGVLSMARSSDPDSGTSSFSILLGDAPHLDMRYTIFGKVTNGMHTMHKMETVETTKSGIFVMPKERITIHSSFMYYLLNPQNTAEVAWAMQDCDEDGATLRLKDRVGALAAELQRTRERCLPAKL